MWTWNFQMCKLDLEKTEEPEIKLPISVGSQRMYQNFRKNICICFIDYAKVFDCVDHNKLWKVLKKMEIPDCLTSLLRNLYAGQETTVIIRYGTSDWFKIGKGVPQGCILSPSLFNLHAENIMWNARLDESQAGIKIVGRNIKYAEDTTLMAKSGEELKGLMRRVKQESEKAGLKLSIKKLWHPVPSFRGK